MERCKMMKINNVEVKDGAVSIEALGNICYEKLEMARQQLEHAEDITICISIKVKDKAFSKYTIIPTNIWEHAEWLDSISDGYSWFTENAESYMTEFDIHDVIMMSISEIADKMATLHKIYQNSIYVHCTKAIQDDGLQCEIYEINEDTEHVFTRVEDTVLEFSAGDMQLIATYVLDTPTGKLCFRQFIPYFKYEYNRETRECKWVEVIR